MDAECLGWWWLGKNMIMGGVCCGSKLRGWWWVLKVSVDCVLNRIDFNLYKSVSSTTIY